MDVRIIACCANLTKELSGLKAHKTLAPANVRYARRQMMWGGQVSLPTRERFRTANTTEITAIAGQKILFSGRASMMLSSEVARPEEKSNNGDTIAA
jgi:hypothetical protein